MKAETMARKSQLKAMRHLAKYWPKKYRIEHGPWAYRWTLKEKRGGKWRWFWGVQLSPHISYTDFVRAFENIQYSNIE